IATRPSLAFHGNMKVAVAEARTLVEEGRKVAFFASSTGEVERLADILNEYAVPYQLGLEQHESTPGYLAERTYMSGSAASIFLVKGQILHGTAFQDSKLVIFGSEDLFETSELVSRGPRSKTAMEAFSADAIDLKAGDYVVHAEHGVAQYLGLREITQGESKGDYMVLEYAGGSKLYVPLTRMDLIQRFRGAGEGKQVAILAPTTVLAFQHSETFKRRFQPFPVRVEMFSRFRTAKELKALVEDLAEGKIDVAIGTHRLLSLDVQFKDLGLVVVDEEQRFGVKHKERLKHLKKAVDVISMSATPIPRTLHMSLLGLRDMSVIETPP